MDKNSTHPVVIGARHIHKTYGTNHAVDDVGFTVERGTCVGFLGPNGAGKTTVMKILYGKAEADRVEETRINVFGYDPRKDQLQIKQISGVVTQEDSLDEELNVVQNLRVYAKFYGITGRKASSRIDELLEFMELGEKKRSRIKELSGGMKRRLVIARSLLGDPSLLILDEPTTGLDPQVRRLIWDRLQHLKRTGVTILLTTHYMQEAAQLSEHLVIMDHGKVLLTGAPDKLLSDEIEPYVLELKNKERSGEIERMMDEEEVRREEYAERMVYYTRNSGMFNSLVGGLSPGEYHIRQSDLEDLFLKTTGRNLNELQ
ncbi:MAG: ABC transporter ATP-binding protein [Spirochaetia bacterium]